MSKKIVFYMLIILFCIGIAPKTFQNDTFFTIACGEQIFNEGLQKIDKLTWHKDLQFTNDRYLFDIIITLIYNKLGFFGIYLFVIIMTAIIGLSLFYIYNKMNNNMILSFLFTISTLYLGRQILAARAQIISIWLFIIENYFIIKLLNSNKNIYSLGLIFVAILLSNVHASIFLVYFIFYLPYFAEFLLSKIIKDDGIDKKIIINSRKNILKLFITFIISIFMGFCSPLGLAPYTSMLKAANGISLNMISELQPMTLVYSINFMIYFIIVIAIITFTKIKIDLADAFMLIGTSLMAINMYRTVFYFIFVGSIFIIKIINNFLKEYHIYEYNISSIIKKIMYSSVVIYIVLYSFINISNKLLNNYIDTLEYPVYACDYINSYINKDNMRIYNTFDYGSYMEYKGIKTFIDSRSGMFSKEFNDTTVLEDFHNINSGIKHYRDVFNKYDINYVLINNSNLINIYIADDKDWKMIYNDDCFSLYEKI